MEQTPVIIVLVGITGDLAKRKLLPALAQILSDGRLTKECRVLGITRQEGVDPGSLLEGVPKEQQEHFRERLEIFTMDVTKEAEYQRLSSRLEEIEQVQRKDQEQGNSQRLFYLSVPPDASRPVIGMLGRSGLSKVPGTKLLIEKPFGSDYASAKELLEYIAQHFSPEQVFRIDHYLSKEFSRSFAKWREEDEIAREYWNGEYLEKIEILASERIGIEHRANFYEQTGALRDLVQSHLLQLAALSLMDDSSAHLPTRRLAALKELHLANAKDNTDKEEAITLGQYEGYREEVKNPQSTTETYVSLRLVSDDPAWKDVSIRVTTGKMLDKKLTKIRAFYKDGNFPAANATPNTASKTGDEVTFQDNPSGIERGSEAYEKVFIDAIAGNQTFFVSAPEVLECWRIIEPVLEFRHKLAATSSKTPHELCIYKPGSTPF